MILGKRIVPFCASFCPSDAVSPPGRLGWLWAIAFLREKGILGLFSGCSEWIQNITEESRLFLLRNPLCPSPIFLVLLCFLVKTQGGTESAEPWLTVASAFLSIYTQWWQFTRSPVGSLQSPSSPIVLWGQCQWPSWLSYCRSYCIVILCNVLTTLLGNVVPE